MQKKLGEIANIQGFMNEEQKTQLANIQQTIKTEIENYNTSKLGLEQEHGKEIQDERNTQYAQLLKDISING